MLIEKPDQTCGAVVSFAGIVRNHHEGKKVARLFYDCYTSMAEKEIKQAIDEAKKDFGIDDIRVLHRTGWLEVGEIAVVIIVNASHRGEAFSACRKVIETIKQKVPIWKKEIYADGSEKWVLNCHFNESSL